MSANDPAMLAREYATSDRLERRRQNVTGWLRGEEGWDEALAAIAEARPHRVLDAGCGDGLFTRAGTYARSSCPRPPPSPSSRAPSAWSRRSGPWWPPCAT